jgi:hypothetical protein
MSISEIVMAVLLLTIIGLVAVFFLGIASHRQLINSGPQQCLQCGAQNTKKKVHCYCCGFILDQSWGPDTVLIQRVKRYDEKKMKARSAIQTNTRPRETLRAGIQGYR